jgi:ubiquinone/menaquinone biosynthesis C-methylase UbiE
MSEIARAYDRWSASYDEDINATRDLDGVVLRRSGLPLGGSSVLELGCGTGKNTRWLAEQASSVIAFDFSAGMLARARAAVDAAHVRFEVQDIRERWPVGDASMDVVVGNLVLEHIADLSPVYANAARVLRSGGALYLCELHPYRQLRGGQAHFTDVESGSTVHVPAHVHTVSEYVNGGIEAGLRLAHLGEWHDEGVPTGTAPRLLSVRFQKLSN